MINSNDGGGNVSFNGGQTWTDQEYSTAQFYRVITTNHEPYHICGAQQDNSTACTPSSGWNHLSAAGGFGGGGHYYAVGGCESGYVAPHPVELDIFYAGCYGGSLSVMIIRLDSDAQSMSGLRIRWGNRRKICVRGFSGLFRSSLTSTTQTFSIPARKRSGRQLRRVKVGADLPGPHSE